MDWSCQTSLRQDESDDKLKKKGRRDEKEARVSQGVSSGLAEGGRLLDLTSDLTAQVFAGVQLWGQALPKLQPMTLQPDTDPPILREQPPPQS